MSDSAAGQGGSGLPAGHPLKPISQGHDETSAALPAQQPSAPACFPPAWPVQLGTLTGHWAGCASLGCGSRSQALRVTVWGQGWLWRKLKAVHCWYFWVWCHVIPILWQLAWSVVSCRGMCSALQGRCRAGSRGGDLPSVFIELWPKVAGRASEGQVLWRAWPGEALCASSAEGRAKRC